MEFKIEGNKLLFTREGEIGEVSAVHEGCIRFKATANLKISDNDWTLLPADTPADIRIEERYASFTTGKLTLRIENNGRIAFYRGEECLLKEQPGQTFGFGYRSYRSIGSGLWKASVNFEPREKEDFYGLGHERMNAYSKKGCTVDLIHLNTKTSIPYVYSSLGYGFLWNNPSTGHVELANNRTRWESDCTKGIDFVVIEGDPAKATAALSDLTGHAPAMPEWGMGFWQCRLRYETQDEVLRVARKYKELGIPVSVIIVDYFHWTEQGDYKFDPKYWPDPKAMADELHKMGIKLMVSMWPTINEHSENYRYMLDHNMLMRTATGSNRVFDFYGPQAEIDPTNPAAREFVWNRLKENYIDNGVDALWFDEAEPEIHPEHFDNLIMYEGRGDEVALIYPYRYAQLVYEGFKQMGRDDIVTLTRSAYLGAQKFGALVWSGDIHSSFESLEEQIKSGLNMAMCGLPWWNTDIGGFYGGNIQSDYFKELIVRWFQYGVFCPVTRIHGSRDGHDRSRDIKEPTGGDNELWSFGDRDLTILSELVKLRYRLMPYIKKYMDIASDKGYPVMRPMFFNYPQDPETYKTGDQYMFGDDILFAPIYKAGATEREVYLPEGDWVRAGTENTFSGKQYVKAHAEIDEFIAFVRKGAEVLKCF